MERKVLVHAAQATDELILECADSTFGGIAAMDTWWDKLEIDPFGLEKTLERGRAPFVV